MKYFLFLLNFLLISATIDFYKRKEDAILNSQFNYFDISEGTEDEKKQALMVDNYVSSRNNSRQDSPEKRILSCYFVWNLDHIKYINVSLCTHINIIGCLQSHSNGTLKFDGKNVGIIKRTIRAWKKIHDKLKVLLTLTSENAVLSEMVLSPVSIGRFSVNILNLLNRLSADGFDIDWEFPVWSSGGRASDKDGLTQLLASLNQTLKPSKRLLTIAIAGPYMIIAKAYDMPKLNELVDFVNVMCYDYHMWQKSMPFTGYNAPLHSTHFESFLPFLSRINVEFSAFYIHKLGLHRQKIVLGIPTYGRTYKLFTKYWHGQYALAIGPSDYGTYISYSQICQIKNSTGNNYHQEWDNVAKVSYLWNDERNWLNYEDTRSAKLKAEFIVNENFGGAMIFNFADDDMTGESCGNGPFPIIRTVNNYILN